MRRLGGRYRGQREVVVARVVAARAYERRLGPRHLAHRVGRHLRKIIRDRDLVGPADGRRGAGECHNRTVPVYLVPALGGECAVRQRDRVVRQILDGRGRRRGGQRQLVRPDADAVPVAVAAHRVAADQFLGVARVRRAAAGPWIAPHLELQLRRAGYGDGRAEGGGDLHLVASLVEAVLAGRRAGGDRDRRDRHGLRRPRHDRRMSAGCSGTGPHRSYHHGVLRARRQALNRVGRSPRIEFGECVPTQTPTTNDSLPDFHNTWYRTAPETAFHVTLRLVVPAASTVTPVGAASRCAWAGAAGSRTSAAAKRASAAGSRQRRRQGEGAGRAERATSGERSEPDGPACAECRAASPLIAARPPARGDFANRRRGGRWAAGPLGNYTTGDLRRRQPRRRLAAHHARHALSPNWQDRHATARPDRPAGPTAIVPNQYPVWCKMCV